MRIYTIKHKCLKTSVRSLLGYGGFDDPILARVFHRRRDAAEYIKRNKWEDALEVVAFEVVER